ncbi:MAG: hypothetical protein JWR85_3741 [Marmoricola sp.]|nr:hypothetical protein [Marmoricola sp.]
MTVVVPVSNSSSGADLEFPGLPRAVGVGTVLTPRETEVLALARGPPLS